MLLVVLVAALIFVIASRSAILSAFFAVLWVIFVLSFIVGGIGWHGVLTG